MRRPGRGRPRPYRGGFVWCLSDGEMGWSESVRRGRVLLWVIATLSGSGMICVLLAITQAMGLPVLGAVLLLLGATAGLMHALTSRRDMLKLIEQLRSLIASGYPKRLIAPSRDFIPLASTINDVIDQTERIRSDATMKVKELEIQ